MPLLGERERERESYWVFVGTFIRVLEDRGREKEREVHLGRNNVI